MKTTKHIFLAAALCLCTLLNTFGESRPYSGRPATPTQITSDNYDIYGFTAETYLDYVGWYAIRCAEELYGFAALVNNGKVGIKGVLTDDIVVNENVLIPSGTGTQGTPRYNWIPIGNKQYGFCGNFDGQGHTISGLYYRNVDQDYVGLFGYVDGSRRPDRTTRTEISNVGVVDSYFCGRSYVGGICGYAEDGIIITNCYNSGTEWGLNPNIGGIGGICGYNDNWNTINNCYNIGKVIGATEVGAICGTNRGSDINNCYYLAGCAIDGRNVVQNGIGTISQGAAASDVSGRTTSATVEEFASGEIAYRLNGSVSGGTVWRQNLSGDTDASPVLDKTHGRVYVTYPGPFSNEKCNEQNHIYVNGICICGEYEKPLLSNGWYIIDNAGKLYWFADAVNTGKTTICGKLTANIVVNENVLNAEGELNGTPERSWNPIGSWNSMFEGKFDGQGHTISGLYMDNPTFEYVGLFGCVFSAKISNIGIVDSYFHGHKVYTGGICADGMGFVSITNCYNSATVIGEQIVGGICGWCEGIITNCYNIGRVEGSLTLGCGSICGDGSTGMGTSITYCYNTGIVTSKNGPCGIGGTGSCYSEKTNATCYDLVGWEIYDNYVRFIPEWGWSIDQFASGKIAYMLNNKNFNGTVWHQTLFSDPSPVLDPTHNRVTGFIDEVDNVITVHGDLVVAVDYEIPEGKTLVVPTGTSVTTTGEAVITNNGTIKLDGGTISGNNLAGSGNFIYTQLADNEVTLSENSYMYKGSPFTVEDGLVCEFATHTICGKTFSFGGTASYTTNCNVGPATVKWENADGSTISRAFAITPNTNVKITITGNNNTATYNTEEQSISGYTVDIEDATGVYTENDFIFSSTAAASGTTVGTYAMGLSADDFSNTNANFAEVQFVVSNGVLTINKAENAPNMPTTIETYYINTNRVALPDNWQWTENIALEKGDNTATAEYTGEDADNYENVSVEVVVTRTACPHNEGYTIINTAEPTCTEEGYTGDHLCNICNEIFEQGESIEANGHNYSSTVTDPTCTEVGYTTHTCSVCEYTYNSDTVSANGHTPDSIVFENIIAATCTAAGSYDSVVYCSVCQAEQFREGKEVASNGHSYSNTVTAPTCTNVGYTTHVCSVCEYNYNSDTVAALGHTEVVDATIAATCTEAGKTEGKHCSVCNEVIVAQTEVAALGHDFGEYVYNNDATTDADGTETATCSRCGEKDTQVAEGTKLVRIPENDGTAVSESAANEINIYAHGNRIVVENATDEISVYNAMGALIRRDATHCVRVEFPVTATGVYIVKTGSVVKRVVVN